MKISARMITRIAVFIALEIVLNRFLAINTPYIKISFNFVPIVVCAMMYGPWWAAAAWAVSDLVGALFLNTVGGAYFPGFTLTLAFAGAVYGLLLRRDDARFFPHVVTVSLVYPVLLSYGLNTLWISIVYGTPVSALLVTRLPQCLTLTAAHLVLVPLLMRLAKRLPKEAES